MVMPQADAPGRRELVDALQVPARLCAGIAAAAGTIGGQRAAFLAAEIFALQFEIAMRAIPLRRPFVDAVQPPDFRAAAEAVRDDLVERIEVVVGAFVGAGALVGGACTPAGALADVIAQVGE